MQQAQYEPTGSLEGSNDNHDGHHNLGVVTRAGEERGLEMAVESKRL